MMFLEATVVGTAKLFLALPLPVLKRLFLETIEGHVKNEKLATEAREKR